MTPQEHLDEAELILEEAMPGPESRQGAAQMAIAHIFLASIKDEIEH